MNALSPPGGPDLTLLYQVIAGMDAKLDRLIDTFVTVREHTALDVRVATLESRWRQNMAWIVALIGALASVAYFIVYLTR